MKFKHITNEWMENASEDELRSVEDDMSSELNSLDYDSEDYLDLDLQRIDVVNTIASRFPINLSPYSEYGYEKCSALVAEYWQSRHHAFDCC